MRNWTNHAWACLILSLSCAASAPAAPADYFRIQVIDPDTGRGVPAVELTTTSQQRYYTDSNGYVAFLEPGLMGTDVHFSIASHGYLYPADGFGYRGTTLRPTAGGSATVQLPRVNLAERLYRATGQGIYRDSTLLGRPVPIAQPNLSGLVVGQDSVQAAVYKGKVYWLWGDTNRPSYPLGNFGTSGATSLLPGSGGLDPSAGINYTYFTDASGFSRKMMPLAEPGLVWMDALTSTTDAQGNEKLVAHYARMESLATRLEHGVAVFDDVSQKFKRQTVMDANAPITPVGHAFDRTVAGTQYTYFTAPYPNVRTVDSFASLSNPFSYETYTPLKEGARYSADCLQLDRDANGNLVWGWKKNTDTFTPEMQQALIDRGAMTRDESPFRLRDVDTGKPIALHESSVNFNAYLGEYLMIGVQSFGDTLLGEVYVAHAPTPEGPWVNAKKVATHNLPGTEDDMSFYNPTQLPFFDQSGGRYIYFQGTFSNTFSGAVTPWPYYDYNQMMYRLDLAMVHLPEPGPSGALLALGYMGTRGGRAGRARRLRGAA